MDTLPDAELEVMKLLWIHGPCTARELQNAGKRRKPWARTTVLTLLKRLEDRGLIHVDREAFSHTFEAAVDRDELLDRALGGLAEEYCEGSTLPLVQRLVENRTLSNDELDELKSLIRTLDRKKKS